MYLDRLDGRITAEFFDLKSNEWREHQRQIDARIALLATSDLRSRTEALRIMKSVSDACAGFSDAQPQHQRALVSAMMQSPTWKAGKFESSWKSPFDKMALSNFVSQTKEREKPGSGQEIEIWLGKQDSNRRPLG
jgi:hypothetical protein